MPVIMKVSRTVASLFFCQSVVVTSGQLQQYRFHSALRAEAIGSPQTSGKASGRLSIFNNAETRERATSRRTPLTSLCVALLTAISFAVAGAQTTTTTLSVTPTSAPNGSVFAMTATVKSGAALMTGGTVTFRDTYNTITQVLGTVQVQSGKWNQGQRSVCSESLAEFGTHSIVATYNAPKTFSNQLIFGCPKHC